MEYKSRIIQENVYINAPVATVWNFLVQPGKMKKWMLDEDAVIEISTDWIPGNPIVVKGELHGMSFENTGTVLSFQPGMLLSYTHLSSISELENDPANFCRLTFQLDKKENATELNFSVSNFPTESIYRHMEFYWKTALLVLKRLVEAAHNDL